METISMFGLGDDLYFCSDCDEEFLNEGNTCPCCDDEMQALAYSQKYDDR